MNDDTWRFPAIFDLDAFAERKKNTEVYPRREFEIDWGNPENGTLVRTTLESLSPGAVAEPKGALTHPFLCPGGPYRTLWDWDSYFTGLGVGHRYPEAFKGSILNFLTNTREDGHPPKLIASGGGMYAKAMALPLFAQFTVAVSRATDDWTWYAEHWDTLESIRGWFERRCRSRRDLFRVPNGNGNGFDNDPVLYARRADTVSPIHVNAFHYRELRAMAFLASRIGQDERSRFYDEQADHLREAICRYCWDPVDGMMYHVDLSDLSEPEGQPMTWEIPYKVKVGASLVALWAGVPSVEQARRMITEHLLNPEEYRSRFGIRSLARNEPLYNNVAMGAPSNWQGPVWGLCTWWATYGMAKYGFRSEALGVAQSLIDTFAGDIRTNGVVHEYYHAETGAPLIHPGFLSWNLLGIRVLGDLRNGTDPSDMCVDPVAIGEVS